MVPILILLVLGNAARQDYREPKDFDIEPCLSWAVNWHTDPTDVFSLISLCPSDEVALCVQRRHPQHPHEQATVSR